MSKDLQVRQRRAKLRSPGVGRRRGKQGAHDQSDEHHGQRVVEIRFYGLRVWGWGLMGMGRIQEIGNWGVDERDFLKLSLGRLAKEMLMGTGWEFVYGNCLSQS